MSDGKSTNTPPAKPKTVKNEGARAPEKDGAPFGHTFRLLLEDHKEWGPKGRIVTLTKKQASDLTSKQARVPTPSEKEIGLR